MIGIVGSGTWLNDNEEISRKQDISSLERISLANSDIYSENWSGNDGSWLVRTDVKRLSNSWDIQDI